MQICVEIVKLAAKLNEDIIMTKLLTPITLATIVLTKICLAATPVYCPQTIQAYCNTHSATGPVSCSITSQPSNHFDYL